MKLLIYSPLFYPNIGGLETIVSILAHEFVHKGHQVRLVSQIPSADDSRFPFEVVRRPSALSLLELMNWCELYFQPNISLKGIWPLFLVRKPWVVSHNGWYTRTNGTLGWQDYLKHFFIRFATCISVSQAVAEHVAVPSAVIPNPYREDIFYERPEIQREKELIFVGRLVSDKGVDLLLNALAELKQQGLAPKLTIVGGGPEEPKLQKQAMKLGISNQVVFEGVKTDEELAKWLNAHKILVVPSRWNEPFGIVALEGIACGCVVIGSAGGGLKDAIGPCGVTFPNGDVEALKGCLANLLMNSSHLQEYRQHAREHLSGHRPGKIAKAYLGVFQQALNW